jgi:GPH family glycoside/pentoside/hexuronide:cation symporter
MQDAASSTVTVPSPELSAAPPDDVAVAASQRVSVPRKLLYGSGELVVGIRMAALNTVLFPFYTDVALLTPALVGLAIALGRVWDGVNDPITGWLSDRTRTRFGRRRPYLGAMILPLAFCFAALWRPPAGTTMEVFAYLVGALFLLDVFFGFYATPYLALGAELSTDYAERARVVSVRAMFHNVGLLFGGGVFLGIAQQLGGGRDAYATAGFALAGLMLVGGVIAFLGTREPAVAAPTDAASWRGLVADLKSTLRLRSFRIIVAGSALAICGSSINQAFAFYVFRDAFGADTRAGLVIAVYLLAATLSFPFWAAAAGRFGKNLAFAVCLVWSVVGLCASPMIHADWSLGAVLAFIFVAGMGVGGYVLPLAIVADVFDEDELESGKRREGAFFGVWTLAMKLAAAVGILLAGQLLPLLGYVPGAEQQTPQAIWLLKLAWGPLPAAFFVATILVVRRFPLDQERVRTIQAALAARRPGVVRASGASSFTP